METDAKIEAQIEERECERLARCLHQLGPIDLDDPEMWNLRLTDRELRAGASVLSPFASIPYFAINMGGKAKEKDWGLENWRALLARLSSEYEDAGLLIIGAAEDSERARRIADVWDGPVIDACG